MEYPPSSSQPPHDPHSQYPQQPYQQPGYSQYPQQPGYPQQPYQQPMYAPPPMQPPPPKKKRRAPWIIVGIIVLLMVVCGAIGSLASHGSNTGTVVAATNDTATQPSGTTPTASTQHFKVGQIVQVGSTFEVTVNSVKTNATGDTISQPKSGNEYLLVDVSIKNISTQPQSVSSLVQWKLRDTTGLSYTEAITDLGQPPDGSIEAGSPIRGVFVYEIPLTQKAFTLSFQPDIMNAGETTWDIAM